MLWGKCKHVSLPGRMLNLYYYTFAQKSEPPVNLVHTRSPLVRDDHLPARYSRLGYPQSKFS